LSDLSLTNIHFNIHHLHQTPLIGIIGRKTTEANKEKFFNEVDPAKPGVFKPDSRLLCERLE
jgi:hypothetical protein